MVPMGPKNVKKNYPKAVRPQANSQTSPLFNGVSGQTNLDRLAR
jgi:hypothetical protein